MKTKQAFQNTLLVYFLIPAVFIAFNYTIDPYGRYQQLASKKTLQELADSSSKVLITELNYNDRLFLKNFISSAPKPDLVILGGSRAANIDSDIFKPEAGRVLNAGVTSASLRDYTNAWNFLKSEGKIPKRVLLLIDLQSVYSTPEEINPRILLSLLSNIGRNLPELKKYLKSVLKTGLAEADSYLSPLSSSDVLTKSFIRLINGNKPRSRLAEKSELTAREAARTSSLAILAPETSEEKKQQAFIDHWGKENGKGESSTLSDWSHFRNGAFEELSSLIKDIRAKKSELIVMIMPSHPLSYELVEKKPVSFSNLLRFIKIIRELCAQYGVPLYDGLHEHHQDVLNADFMDGVHLKKKAAYSFLKRAARELNLSFIEG